MVATTHGTTVEAGGYLWRGEARLYDNEAIIGAYIADEGATRSKGAPTRGLVMAEHECVELTVTAEDQEWLGQWAESLVEGRLAACVHNITPIQGIYRWEGEIHDDPQGRIAIHTRASLVQEIVKKADHEHADHVPCVIALPIAGGHPVYLKWVHQETRAPTRRLPQNSRSHLISAGDPRPVVPDSSNRSLTDQRNRRRGQPRLG